MNKAAPTYDPLMTCTDAASYLSLHPREIRRLAAIRELAVVRRGQRGHIKFRLSELNRWIERNTLPASRHRN